MARVRGPGFPPTGMEARRMANGSLRNPRTGSGEAAVRGERSVATRG